MKKNLIITIFILLLQNIRAWAVVDSIEITGLSRTDKEVIIRELPYRIGENIDANTSQLAQQKIYNLQLFSSVVHQVIESENKQSVKIDVKERWTTIPILKFSNGGGITQYTVGAYDINLFGKYIEGGVQLESRGPSKSGVIWYRNPRLLGKRLRLSLDLWNVKHVYRLYEESGRLAELEHAYLQEERRISSELKYNFTDQVAVGLVFSNHSNQYSNDILSEEEKVASSLFPLPAKENHSSYGFKLELGIINYGPWNQRGQIFEIRGENTRYEIEEESKSELSNEIFVDYKNFIDLPWESTIAFHGNYEHKTNPTDSDKVFVGGLDKIRGFLDNRFKGHTTAMTNLEYRIPSYQFPWFVLQHTVFFDYANIIDESRDNDTLRNEIASVGTGIRFISPKIYRLVGRLDFAKPVKGNGKLPISFGVQQFF